MQLAASYTRNYPGLAEAIATSPSTRDHRALIDRLRHSSGLENAQLATSRGDTWLVRRKVFTADGTLVASDHQEWLTREVARSGGNVRAACAHLDAARYRLSLCQVTTLFIVLPGPSAEPSNFLQVEVTVEDEILDRELLPGEAWSPPTTLDALQREADQGPKLPECERVPVRPPAYHLRRVVDIEAWMQVADALEEVQRESFRERRYRVTSSARPEGVIRTSDEMWPDWDRYAPKHRRFFQDWARSSAGQHRLCDHWVLDLKDWTDPRSGHRSMEMIPLWAFNRPLAKVNAVKGSEYEFYGALEKLDRRVGVPFAWFFYMVHGNRVDADAGDRVIRAAEAGTIVIPERDYRVLKDWQAAPYGF